MESFSPSPFETVIQVRSPVPLPGGNANSLRSRRAILALMMLLPASNVVSLVVISCLNLSTVLSKRWLPGLLWPVAHIIGTDGSVQIDGQGSRVDLVSLTNAPVFQLSSAYQPPRILGAISRNLHRRLDGDMVVGSLFGCSLRGVVRIKVISSRWLNLF